MTSGVFYGAAVHLGIGEINWSSGQQASIFATLMGNTQPTQNVSGGHYSDLSGQIGNGNGYTTGGLAFTSLTTAVLASNVCNFGGADNQWTGLTATPYFMVINHGTLAGSTNALLSYHDLGGAQAITNGTLILHWPTGVSFYMTITAGS